MSSTRYVESGERRRQNGWASAVELSELRGISGTAVALKASLLNDPKERELLYAIQALSLRAGGLKRIVNELLEMPGWLGTKSMRAFGCKSGKALTADQCWKIECELDKELYWRDSLHERAVIARQLLGKIVLEEAPRKPRPARKAEDYLAQCRSLALGGGAEQDLAECITEICCAPENKFASPRYFNDLPGALREYCQQQVERARADYVKTSIGEICFEALDYVLETGRPALVEGNSGFGKTTALKAWCDMHPGQARYVQLSGITNRTTFFHKLSEALNVADGKGYKPNHRQIRIYDFLKATKLMLVIDEGHYLWPQARKVDSHPELINWLNTDCYNEGVPFLISATQQFTERRQAVEKYTNWASEQTRRRTRRVFPLPDTLATRNKRMSPFRVS